MNTLHVNSSAVETPAKAFSRWAQLGLITVAAALIGLAPFAIFAIEHTVA